MAKLGQLITQYRSTFGTGQLIVQLFLLIFTSTQPSDEEMCTNRGNGNWMLNATKCCLTDHRVATNWPLSPLCHSLRGSIVEWLRAESIRLLSPAWSIYSRQTPCAAIHDVFCVDLWKSASLQCTMKAACSLRQCATLT